MKQSIILRLSTFLPPLVYNTRTELNGTGSNKKMIMDLNAIEHDTVREKTAINDLYWYVFSDYFKIK